MTKTTVVLATVLFGVMLVCVTVLLALGRNPESLITFLVGTIVPSVIAFYTLNRADTAVKVGEAAAVAATKAERNTNGRLAELIAAVHQLGGTVDREKYHDVWPDHLDEKVPPNVD